MNEWIFLSTCFVSGPAVTSELDLKWFLPSGHLQEAGRGSVYLAHKHPQAGDGAGLGGGRERRGRRPGEGASPRWHRHTSQVSRLRSLTEGEERGGVSPSSWEPGADKAELWQNPGAAQGQEQSTVAATGRTWSRDAQEVRLEGRVGPRPRKPCLPSLGPLCGRVMM